MRQLGQILGMSVFVVTATVGCVSLPAVTSGQIGCAEKDITIADDEQGFGTRTWTAECHGTKYFCSSHGGGKHSTAQVSCKASGESAESTSARTSSPASSDREDSQVCRAASKVREDFGAYWASKSGGVLLDDPPTPRDFIVTCQSMPETVQRCMHDKYRRAHQQACTAFLARLDAASKDRIDALYLQAPTEAKPRTTAPGTSL